MGRLLLRYSSSRVYHSSPHRCSFVYPQSCFSCVRTCRLDNIGCWMDTVRGDVVYVRLLANIVHKL